MPKLDEYLRIKEAAEYVPACEDIVRDWGRSAKTAEHRFRKDNYPLHGKTDLQR